MKISPDFPSDNFLDYTSPPILVPFRFSLLVSMAILYIRFKTMRLESFFSRAPKLKKRLERLDDPTIFSTYARFFILKFYLLSDFFFFLLRNLI